MSPSFTGSLGPGGLCILGLLSGWFLISIPNQLTNRYGRWVNRINPYGFIPKWTFFAPVPGTFNFRLLYRDVLADGSIMQWEEIEWCRKRSWLDAVWHPRRLASKLLIDSISGIYEVVALMAGQGIDIERNPQGLILSTPYVLLLNLVMGMPKQSPSSTARQMAIFQQDPLVARNTPVVAARIGQLILCSTAHGLRQTVLPEDLE